MSELLDTLSPVDFWAWADEHGVGITAIATVALVLATVATLWVAGNDSRRRNRPMVSGSFVFGENSPDTILLRIKNYGPTRAEDVVVTFTPELQVDSTTELVRNRFSGPIGVLNPGETLENAWYIPKFVGNEHVGNQYAYPDQVTVRITYRGVLWKRRVDTTRLNVATHLHTSTVVSSSSLLGSVRRIAKALEKK